MNRTARVVEHWGWILEMEVGMDWLKNNFVVDMPGPLFLLLYAGFIVLILVLCWWRIRVAEPGAALPPPPVPARPDPFAIAYLRSGANEVARLVVFALLQQGFLRVAWAWEENAESNHIERVANGPEMSQLSGIERHALEWFDRPRDVKDIFQTDGLKSRLADYCAEYEQRLRNEHLLTSNATTTVVSRTGSYGALAILILGGIGLYVARSKGIVRQEEAGLLASVGLFLTMLPFLIFRRVRLSRRGRACLRQLQLAFGGLKSQAAVSQTAGMRQPPFRPRNDPVRAASSALMIVLGVFGHKVLSGSAPTDYGRLFPQAPDGDCGASCSCG
jgi:uncharacterized protein (TIGR04222 family)